MKLRERGRKRRKEIKRKGRDTEKDMLDEGEEATRERIGRRRRVRENERD